jgi:hypothetical protein
MEKEYFPCDCCGKMTRDIDFWTSKVNKNMDVCEECHSCEVLKEEEESSCTSCTCWNGCMSCLDLSYRDFF